MLIRALLERGDAVTIVMPDGPGCRCFAPSSAAAANDRWATSLPPALAVAAILAFGLVFGVPGILFAVPLTIVIVSLVESLYVEGLLHKRPVSG